MLGTAKSARSQGNTESEAAEGDGAVEEERKGSYEAVEDI